MGLLPWLLCLIPLLAHTDCKNIVGILGENFTFPVQLDQKVVEIVWTKDGHKMAEWEGQNKPTYFGPLRNRGVLMENGSLTIVNLEKNDAGTYKLAYWDSVNDDALDFVLHVLDSLPEPEISCNSSNGELLLNCTAHFQRSLHYYWKLSNDPRSYEKQELSIPWENVDASTNATCIIKFLQMERRSEIRLIPCLPEEKGNSSYRRGRGVLIVVLILSAAIITGIIVLLHKKGIIKVGTGRRPAHNNSPVNGSGEHERLFLGNSHQQPNSEGAVVLACGSETTEVETMKESESEKRRRIAMYSHTVHCENEEPEEDAALNEDDSALKDTQIVKNSVNQEDILKNSRSLLANHDHADDHGISEGEVSQDAEGGNGEHLNNSFSCSKEDIS